jgi:cytochrome c oxidase assembly protein subunit 15
VTQTTHQLESPWPHRLAVLLVCATFPLIWVGGLVTTYGAGMAVPDWPTTYGYNLFLYPWQTWVYGPWDLFIEHGHRLFAAAVGLLTIALAVALWRRDQRAWMRRLGVVALAGVIAQGVLGGMRVRLDQRLLAQIHGCVAPAFFALTAAMAVFTSRRWRDAERPPPREFGGHRGLGGLAIVTTVLVYAQLLLGSQLRHVAPTADATVFRATVLLHLFVAVLLALHAAAIFIRAGGRRAGVWHARPARALAALTLVQLNLGGAAWVVKYGWPAWVAEYDWAAGFVVSRNSPAQALITTAHVATGSLILAVSLTLALRAIRLAHDRPRPAGLGKLGMGVAA